MLKFFSHWVCVLGFLGIALTAWSDGPGPGLEDVLPGTQQQSVKFLDRKGLSIVLNEELQDVQIEGWTTKTLSASDTDKLLKQFGVRTVSNKKDGTDYFLAPNNVGRSGVREGATYLVLDGKYYKALTLKGYGGNTVHGRDLQPGGSLDFDESIRDMEVSKIFLENHIDTYVGLLTIKRPHKKEPQANFVRLSRTAMRMEDLSRIHGQKLVKLVDYLTDLLKDELGKKLSFAEFDQWLIQKNADLMARKDYLRFEHASVTYSNLGIGEMVDLGDIEDGRGLKLPGQYKGQNLKFKGICKDVHANLAKVDSSLRSVNFESLYSQAYQSRLRELRAFDKARVNFNTADLNQLITLGFKQDEAEMVLKYNHSVSDGIIDPEELLAIKTISRTAKKLLNQATTHFMRLSDGSQLSSYYIRNVGGPNGVREILKQCRELLKEEGIQLARDSSGRILGDVGRAQVMLESLAVEQAKKQGFDHALMGNDITHFSKFIARQSLEVLVRR